MCISFALFRFYIVWAKGFISFVAISFTALRPVAHGAPFLEPIDFGHGHNEERVPTQIALTRFTPAHNIMYKTTSWSYHLAVFHPYW